MYEERLAEVVEGNEWLREHPPTFERFSIQFEAAETDADEPVVVALQSAMGEIRSRHDASRGDVRCRLAPLRRRRNPHRRVRTWNERTGSLPATVDVRWPDVLTAGTVLTEAALSFSTDPIPHIRFQPSSFSSARATTRSGSSSGECGLPSEFAVQVPRQRKRHLAGA